MAAPGSPAVTGAIVHLSGLLPFEILLKKKGPRNHGRVAPPACVGKEICAVRAQTLATASTFRADLPL